MFKIKKVFSVALAASMALSLASCSTNLGGADISYIAEIDGYKVPAGVYIYSQMSAYYEAMYYVDPIVNASPSVSEESGEVVSATTAFKDKMIDGIPVSDWINDTATTDVMEMVAIDNKFDELGLVVPEIKYEELDYTISNMWSADGEMMEDLGISQTSVEYVTLNSYKRGEIFKFLYGEGGEKEVSEDEIKGYLTDNFARINYIDMILKDAEGNLLKSDGKTEVEEMANGYIERINSGEDFNAVLNEYNDYFEELTATPEEGDGLDLDAPEDVEIEDDNTVLVGKDYSYPSKRVIEKIFDGTISEGKTGLVKDDESYYVVTNLGVFSDEEYYENEKEPALNALKGEEYDAEVTSWTESQNVVKNESAYKVYKYTKFEQN